MSAMIAGSDSNSSPTKLLIEPTTAESEKQSPMDMLIERVNGQGLYQWLIFMVFNFHWFLAGWFLLGIGFYFETAPFVCPEEFHFTESECQEYVCSLDESMWGNFMPHIPNTVTYEWEWLVCGRTSIKSTLQSIIALGSGIGFFVFPYYADNYGRRWTMIIAWMFFTVGVLLMAVANGPIMVGIGQFLIGFGGNPVITLDFSFINQVCSSHARQYFSIGVQLFFAIAQCLVGYVVILWMADWRNTCFLMLGISVLVAILNLFVLETPKYMISKDLPKAMEIFNKIAKINGRQPVSYDDVLEVYEKQEVVSNDKNNLLILFKFQSLRSKTISTGILFLGLQIIYYCQILSIGTLGYKSYENQLAVGLSQAISYIVAQFAIPHLPRKLFSFIGMASSGILCLAIAVLTIFTDSQDVVALVLLFAMRFILCMYWAALFVYLAELYPTRVRSLAFGWSSAVGTVGSFSAPFVILLAQNLNLNEWIVPGAVGLIATVAVIPLPETLGKPLSEQIYEKKKSTILKNTLRSNLLM